MPDANSLNQARSAVTAARATRNALLAQVASASREVQQLARVLPPNDQRLAEVRQRQQGLGAQLSESNAAVREAQSGLNRLIGGFLGQLQGNADFASLT